MTVDGGDLRIPSVFPQIVMPAVRHTGSQFLLGLLGNRITLRGSGDGVVFDHTYDGHMPHFRRWLESVDTVVIPLRDPEMVARSWAKRGEHKHWEMQWRNLFWFDQFDPLYVCIDHPEREVQLQAVSERLGKPIETDWKPVNESHGPIGDMPEYEWLYQNPVIGRFYEPWSIQ